MKIRVENNRVRETVTCENGADTTLGELKRIIATQFHYSADEAKDLELSLNGRDKLEDDEKSLSEIGLVCGDLVFVLQHGTISPYYEGLNNTQTCCHGDRSGDSNSLPAGSSVEGEEMAEEKRSLDEEGEMAEGRSLSHIVSAREDLDVEMADPAIVVNKCLHEPLLCRESTETSLPSTLQVLYDNYHSESETDLLWLVLHTLMLESGFTSVSRTTSNTVRDKCRLPDQWKTDTHYETVYNHINIPGDLTCRLVGVCMGSKLVVHGKISTTTSESQHIQLKVEDFVSTVESGVRNPYRNLSRLSMLVKDGLTQPLLQDFYTALGLPAMVGLLGLNLELKMKVLSFLDCVSLLRVGEVCRQLSSLSKDPFLWRALYLRRFGASTKTDLSQNWYEMYKKEYKNRQEMKKQNTYLLPEFFHPRPHPLPPFAPVFPHHGIIGGDYDMGPQFPGIPDPLSRSRDRLLPGRMRLPPPHHHAPPPHLLPGREGQPERRPTFPGGPHWFGSALGKRFF